jgi:hypothetical protein
LQATVAMLAQALEDLQVPLNVAERRLQIHQQRPRRELIEDEVQLGLKGELNALRHQQVCHLPSACLRRSCTTLDDSCAKHVDVRTLMMMGASNEVTVRAKKGFPRGVRSFQLVPIDSSRCALSHP